jgi:ribosomal-protein-alanine N-acetyltransferase
MTAVRRAVADDAAAVAAVEARAFADGAEQAWSRQSVDDEFAALGVTREIVVAVEDGEIVGHAVLMSVGDRPDIADVTRVAVDPSCRRRGVGSQLLASLLATPDSAGLDAVLLEVAAGNAAARALYERHGFEPVDRRAAYYPDGSDAVVMRRPCGGGADDGR